MDCYGRVDRMDVDAETLPGVVEGVPIWLWAGDRCSAFGSAARDWQGRARRQLALIESKLLAAELWDGDLTGDDDVVDNDTPLENRYLAGPGGWSDTVTSGPTDLVRALACVEQGMAHYLNGGQGMIHLTNSLLVHLVAAQVLTRQGNVWTSPAGHIVVADAGYTGSGPNGVAADADSQWIYGTPVIQVRLSPVEVIPGDITQARALGEALDNSVNTIRVYAGRAAAFQWTSECAHVAAQVDEGVCLLGGVS